MSNAATQRQPEVAPLKLRPAVPGDVAFLSSTWKQNFWRESPWANRIRWPIFDAGHAPIVQRLLERSKVLVACDPTLEDEIAGYAIFSHEPNVLHWAYVKPAFRRAGVFAQLLAATGFPADLSGVEITHGTRAWFSASPMTDRTTGRELKPGRLGLESKYPGAVHNPYRWAGLP